MVSRAIRVAALGLCCFAIIVYRVRSVGPITDGWQLGVSGSRRAVPAGEPVILHICVSNFSRYARMVLGSRAEGRYALFASFRDKRTGSPRKWAVPQPMDADLYLSTRSIPRQTQWTLWRDSYCVSNVIDTTRPGEYVLQLATQIDLNEEGNYRAIDVRSNPVTVTVTDDGLNHVRRDVYRAEGTRSAEDSGDRHIAATSETQGLWDKETPERVELAVAWTNRAPVARKLELARDPLDDLEIKVLGVSPYLLGISGGETGRWGSPKRETSAELEADDRLGRPTFRRYSSRLAGAAPRDPFAGPTAVLLESGDTVRYHVPLSRLFDLTAVGTYLVSVRPRWAVGSTSGETTRAPVFGTLETHVVIRHGRPWEMSFGPMWHG